MATYRNIVGTTCCTRLANLLQYVASRRVLLASSFTTCRTMIQQCIDVTVLRWHISIVWSELLHDSKDSYRSVKVSRLKVEIETWNQTPDQPRHSFVTTIHCVIVNELLQQLVPATYHSSFLTCQVGVGSPYLNSQCVFQGAQGAAGVPGKKGEQGPKVTYLTNQSLTLAIGDFFFHSFFSLFCLTIC